MSVWLTGRKQSPAILPWNKMYLPLCVHVEATGQYRICSSQSFLFLRSDLLLNLKQVPGILLFLPPQSRVHRHVSLSWLAFGTLDISLHYLRRQTSVEEIPLPDWLVGEPVGHYLDYWMMWEGSAHCERCLSGKVVLDSLRKQTEQARRRKSVSSTPGGYYISPHLQVPALLSCQWWTIICRIK